MRLPQEKILEMFTNIIMDFVIGLVPVLGDIGDFAFKANTKNLKILRNYAEGVKKVEPNLKAS